MDTLSIIIEGRLILRPEVQLSLFTFWTFWDHLMIFGGFQNGTKRFQIENSVSNKIFYICLEVHVEYDVTIYYYCLVFPIV